MPIHVDAAKTRLIETAAEPKSFAKPDSGFSSTPILSTTTSIAVLIISTNMTKSTVAIKINCSLGEASMTKVCLLYTHAAAYEHARVNSIGCRTR